MLMLFVLASLTCLAYLIWISDNTTLRIIGIPTASLLIPIWLFLLYREITAPKPYIPAISKITHFAIIGPEGNYEKEWCISGAMSLLIGKDTASGEADIDLSDTQYGRFISNEHAVVNFSQGQWYIEDLGAANGTGIRKKSEDYATRLKPNVSYKIDPGDTIYISKAKIAVI